jgi:hypothetical protein
MKPDMNIGSVVRDRRWGGRLTGTIVDCRHGHVFVAWHDTCVEDELPPSDVELVTDPAAHLTAWHGGIGVYDPTTATMRVEGIRQ